jgi:glycosyltransferase involved in cell wall biosynthesis
VGGVSEAVIDGVTGFCIPPNNPQVLREKLLTLVNEPKLREQMGAAGRSRYEAEFTFEHMFAKTIAVYQDVLST